jgi:opacity protein-like surface antigen
VKRFVNDRGPIPVARFTAKKAKAMKKLMIIAVGAITGWSMGAVAQTPPESFYVRVDTGGSFSTNAGKDVAVDIGQSPIVGAGVGVKVLPFLRTDVTVSYRPSYSFAAPPTPIEPPGTTGRGDVKTLAAMVNAYYDFPTLIGFTPYVGGGVGVARNEVGTTTLSSNATGATVATLAGSTDTQFAWQLSAGASYSILPTIALDIGYRYFDAGEGRSGSTATIAGTTVSFPTQRGNIRAHEIQAGVRVGF